jgi:hypothetical protein
MGKYSKQIEASRGNMSADQIRKIKIERTKARNTRRKAKRRATAEERQEAWEALTPQQQLVALDNRLGKGVGAKKQRARIQERIDGS